MTVKEYLLTDVCRPKQWPTISGKEMLPDGYPVFGANGIIGYYDQYNHEEPTLLITCRGATCGTLNISEPFSYVTGNSMALDDLNKERADLKYLYYYLRNRTLRDTITGTAQPQITRESLKKVRVLLPPLEEQRRIAEVLDRADALRQKRRLALQKLDTLLQSVFLDMFGDGTEEVPFREVFKSVRYGTGSPPEYVAAGKPFIRATDIKGGTVVRKGLKFISETDASRIEKCRVDYGDLVVVRSGVNSGDCCLVPQDLQGAYAAYDLVVQLDLDKAIFYNYVINSPRGKQQMRRLTRRAAQPHLNSEQLGGFKVPRPSNDEMKKFVAVHDRVSTAKEKMGRELAMCDALFASLQNKLFAR